MKKREKLLANYQQENIRGGEFVFIQSITFSMKLKISYVIKHSLLNTSVYWVCRFDSLCYSKNDLMFLLSNFAIDRMCIMETKRNYGNEGKCSILLSKLNGIYLLIDLGASIRSGDMATMFTCFSIVIKYSFNGRSWLE